MTTTHTHPPVFCPVCSQAMDIMIQEFPHRQTPLFLFTCENPACPVYGRTCSDSDIADAATLAKWRCVQVFDVRTGRKVAA